MPQAAIILTTEVYAKSFPKNTRVTMPQAAIILTTCLFFWKRITRTICHNAASGNHSYDMVRLLLIIRQDCHNAASGNHSYDEKENCSILIFFQKSHNAASGNHSYDRSWNRLYQVVLVCHNAASGNHSYDSRGSKPLPKAGLRPTF